MLILIISMKKNTENLLSFSGREDYSISIATAEVVTWRVDKNCTYIFQRICDIFRVSSSTMKSKSIERKSNTLTPSRFSHEMQWHCNEYFQSPVSGKPYFYVSSNFSKLNILSLHVEITNDSNTTVLEFQPWWKQDVRFPAENRSD